MDLGWIWTDHLARGARWTRPAGRLPFRRQQLDRRRTDDHRWTGRGVQIGGAMRASITGPWPTRCVTPLWASITDLQRRIADSVCIWMPDLW